MRNQTDVDYNNSDAHNCILIQLSDKFVISLRDVMKKVWTDHLLAPLSYLILCFKHIISVSPAKERVREMCPKIIILKSVF